MEYRIVCTEQTNVNPHHGHIHHVGTGPNPASAANRWTVAEVRKALADGHVFYTRGERSGQVALVRAYTCCGIETIKSAPDAVLDNNLDNLRTCSWKS